MDHATLEWQQASTPSQHYYGCLIALADIPSGCAPFTVAEGSLRKLREISHSLVRTPSPFGFPLLCLDSIHVAAHATATHSIIRRAQTATDTDHANWRTLLAERSRAFVV
jgi:hypothetical protein